MRTRLISAILSLALAGCTWSQMSGSPADAIASARPERVRVTTLAGREIVLEHPIVSHDSIWGMEERGSVGVPLDSVRRLEGRTADGVRLAWMAAGVVGGVAYYVVAH